MLVGGHSMRAPQNVSISSSGTLFTVALIFKSNRTAASALVSASAGVARNNTTASGPPPPIAIVMARVAASVTTPATAMTSATTTTTTARRMAAAMSSWRVWVVGLGRVSSAAGGGLSAGAGGLSSGTSTLGVVLRGGAAWSAVSSTCGKYPLSPGCRSKQLKSGAWNTGLEMTGATTGAKGGRAAPPRTRASCSRKHLYHVARCSGMSDAAVHPSTLSMYSSTDTATAAVTPVLAKAFSIASSQA